MTTMTITYDGRNKAARAIVEMLRSIDFIHVTEPVSRHKRTAMPLGSAKRSAMPLGSSKNSVDRSLAEFERGETTVCDTFEDYLKSIEA
jgi:hypothetical protein